MLLKFSEWVKAREASLNEGFTTFNQRPGDMVFFGAHGILGMPDDQQIDTQMVDPMIASVISVTPKGVVVSAPKRHNFRKNSIKKFMGKDGSFTIPPDHLQEISPTMVKGINDNSEGKRVFIFTPNAYTKSMLVRKNRRLMTDDKFRQSNLNHADISIHPSTPSFYDNISGAEF